MLQRMGDDRVRYFYMMLGDAIADASMKHRTEPRRANTGPVHLADLKARLNKS
jgi:hypothetical protein